MFSCRIHRKLGIFNEIFLKNWEIRIIWYKINHRSNNLGRKLQKIGFFAKTGTNFHTLFLQIITCGYILAQFLKQLFFPHKNKVEISYKSYLAKTSTIIVENTENLPNSSSYTIEYKLVRISHLLSQKLAFSQVPQQLFFKQAQIALTQIIKAAIDCSYIYCEGEHGKVLQTRTILFKRTIVVTGVRKSTNISTQNTKQIKLHVLQITTKTYHNGSFFSYKKQHFH